MEYMEMMDEMHYQQIQLLDFGLQQDSSDNTDQEMRQQSATDPRMQSERNHQLNQNRLPESSPLHDEILEVAHVNPAGEVMSSGPNTNHAQAQDL